MLYFNLLCSVPIAHRITCNLLLCCNVLFCCVVMCCVVMCCFVVICCFVVCCNLLFCRVVICCVVVLQSLIVRWDPPPPDHRNGVITGYKIRYKKKGELRSATVTTDGNRRLYALTSLDKKTEYQVRISALTVNGSGPLTPKLKATTYEDDLDGRLSLGRHTIVIVTSQ